MSIRNTHRHADLRPFHFALLPALALLAFAACGGGAQAPAQPIPTITGPDNASAAVVRIELLITSGQRAVTRYWGSGSFVGQGIILTSARLLDPNGGWDTIGVAVPGRNGQPASLLYQADIVAIDPSLDIALLKVAADRDGRAIAAESLRVPTLGLASGALPGGGAAMGFSALDSGLAAPARIEFSAGTDGRADWVESQTKLPPGFGGAPILNESGQIVGVVALPESADDRLYVRRADDFQPLVAAALGGKELIRSGRERLPAPDRVALDKPRDLDISRITFYTGVTQTGEPTGATGRFSSGAKRIVYSFDHKGIRTGAKWIDEWLVNGKVDPQLSPPRPDWNRSASGTFVSSITDPRGLPDGVYTLRIVVDGIQIASATTVVGGDSRSAAFKRLTLAPSLGKEGQAVGQADKLESASALFGVFDYEGVESGSRWSYVWYHNGKPMSERSGLLWRGGLAGSLWWVALYQRDGSPLPAGAYTLTLAIDGKTAATANISVTRGP